MQRPQRHNQFVWLYMAWAAMRIASYGHGLAINMSSIPEDSQYGLTMIGILTWEFEGISNVLYHMNVYILLSDWCFNALVAS